MPRSSSMPLAGASVLITHPVGQGRALARQVRALGGQPVLLPGVSLRAAPASARTALRAALEDDLAIFTSPSAVRFAVRLAPLSGSAGIAAVGAGTARELVRHGAGRVIFPHAMQNSEGLLAHPALGNVRGRAIAVIGAPGGRGILQKALRERGARVREVHVYQRVPARLDRRHREALRQLRAGSYILLSSTETLRCLQAALGDKDWQRLVAIQAVVSSGRIGGAARQAGFGRVSVAGSALGADLLARAAELHVSA